MSHKSSRRDFVKRSAAAVAGVIVLPQIIPSTALGMGGKLPPSDRIVFGIIGTGSQGMSDCRDFLRLDNQVQFVALCDVDSNRLAKAKETIDTANNDKGLQNLWRLS